jgi:hypothetical protein
MKAYMKKLEEDEKKHLSIMNVIYLFVVITITYIFSN